MNMAIHLDKIDFAFDWLRMWWGRRSHFYRLLCRLSESLPGCQTWILH